MRCYKAIIRRVSGLLIHVPIGLVVLCLVDFCSPFEVDIEDYKPLSLGTIESSLVDSTLNLPFVEDSKVTSISTKVTCIGYFLLNMIPMLFFLGDRIFSWIHNY